MKFTKSTIKQKEKMNSIVIFKIKIGTKKTFSEISDQKTSLHPEKSKVNYELLLSVQFLK